MRLATSMRPKVVSCSSSAWRRSNASCDSDVSLMGTTLSPLLECSCCVHVPGNRHHLAHAGTPVCALDRPQCGRFFISQEQELAHKVAVIGGDGIGPAV